MPSEGTLIANRNQRGAASIILPAFSIEGAKFKEPYPPVIVTHPDPCR